MAPRSQSSQSWADFAQSLRKQRLMDDMMLVQYVDILAAIREGQAFFRARANCRNCTCAGACRDWFLEGSGAPADFCPNLNFFASVKRGDDQA